MNKKLIIILFILGFLLINSISLYFFVNNYLGNDSFEKEKYSESLDYFEKSKNKESIYNSSNSLYKQKKYTDALNNYLAILSDKKNKFNFYLNHNIANTYYRIGENDTEVESKIENWKNSINYYKNALEIDENEETRKNLEFVEKKLEEVEKDKENEQEQENQKNEENKGEESESGTGSTEKQNKQISPETQKEIEKYEQFLKDIQENNQDFFNKVYEENKNDIFDMFSNDPFFNNDLLEEKGEEKDW